MPPFQPPLPSGNRGGWVGRYRQIAMDRTKKLRLRETSSQANVNGVAPQVAAEGPETERRFKA